MLDKWVSFLLECNHNDLFARGMKFHEQEPDMQKIIEKFHYFRGLVFGYFMEILPEDKETIEEKIATLSPTEPHQQHAIRWVQALLLSAEEKYSEARATLKALREEGFIGADTTVFYVRLYEKVLMPERKAGRAKRLEGYFSAHFTFGFTHLYSYTEFDELLMPAAKSGDAAAMVMLSYFSITTARMKEGIAKSRTGRELVACTPEDDEAVYQKHYALGKQHILKAIQCGHIEAWVLYGNVFLAEEGIEIARSAYEKAASYGSVLGIYSMAYSYKYSDPYLHTLWVTRALKQASHYQRHWLQEGKEQTSYTPTFYNITSLDADSPTPLMDNLVIHILLEDLKQTIPYYRIIKDYEACAAAVQSPHMAPWYISELDRDHPFWVRHPAILELRGRFAARKNDFSRAALCFMRLKIEFLTVEKALSLIALIEGHQHASALRIVDAALLKFPENTALQELYERLDPERKIESRRAEINDFTQGRRCAVVFTLKMNDVGLTTGELLDSTNRYATEAIAAIYPPAVLDNRLPAIVHIEKTLRKLEDFASCSLAVTAVSILKFCHVEFGMSSPEYFVKGFVIGCLEALHTTFSMPAEYEEDRLICALLFKLYQGRYFATAFTETFTGTSASEKAISNQFCRQLGEVLGITPTRHHRGGFWHQTSLRISAQSLDEEIPLKPPRHRLNTAYGMLSLKF